MDISVDKALTSAGRLHAAAWIGIVATIAVVGMLYGGFLLIERIAERLDVAITGEHEIQQEIARGNSRIDQLEQRLDDVNSRMSEAILSMDRATVAAEDRFRRAMEASDRRTGLLIAWLRAGCYASANGSGESRAYCDRVGTMQETP